ncbi:MAG: carboxypeptidase regulatory-like domain-containing protein, partial [Gemmatimonadaceae bacterium]|nr:carboxypeptidase regulatory-like domain-containing protein [Gemmatimonadaceae bacterium]
MINRLRFLLIVLFCVAPLPVCAQLTGSIRGVVRANPTLVGLPYAVVAIPSRNLERFSGADGAYLLTNVPAGDHQLQVRRIGFVPRTLTVRVEAGGVTTLDIHLDQVPVRLAGMIVNPVQPCRRPGLPDSAANPEVWQLVASLRENAATYRSLVNQHPFSYAQARAFGQLVDTIAELRGIDSIVVPGTAEDNYRPGRIVSTSRSGLARETVMRIPTIVELASRSFVSNHCYTYGGSAAFGNETWYRLDMRAADRLGSPDVH